MPPDLLQAAVNQLRKNVTAKKTLYFTHQGEVTAKVQVEDHTTQMSAIDKIISMSGGYVSTRDDEQGGGGGAGAELIIDEKTGVVRLLIGSRAGAGSSSSALPDSPSSTSNLALPPTPVESEDTDNQIVRLMQPPIVEGNRDAEEAEPEIIHVPRRLTDEQILKLFPPVDK